MNHKNKKLPKFLYKYFPMDKPYIERIFKYNELSFRNPNSFNDPFDCKAMLTLNDCNEEDYVKFVINLAIDSKAGGDLDDTKKQFYEERARKAYNSDKNGLIRRINNTIKGNLPKSINEFRVLCLSKTYNNILMWSHYAQGHRGFVLQFDTKALLKNFQPPPQPVIYPKGNSFPSIKDFNERNHMQMFLVTKSRNWIYEKECRILMHIGKRDKPEKQRKVYNFEKGLITGIILGCEMKPPEEKKITTWIREYQPQLIPSIYKAIKGESFYNIKTDPEINEYK